MTRTIIVSALALLLAGTAAAQQPAAAPIMDGRWQQWVGCWQLSGESLTGERMLSPEQVARGAAPPTRASNTGTRVCVAPAGRGVTITTMVGSERALAETIVADGSAQPLQDAECRGARRSEWSKSAPRLYSNADVTCGSEAPRKISTLSMLTPGPIWVDIQVIDISGRKNIRIRRYEPVVSAARAGQPRVGDSSWSVADVIEASSKLAPEAVQAALIELGTGFNVKGKQLLELDRAGVSDSIVDLMVALSYPERFVVERSVASSGGGYGFGTFGGDDGSMWPFYLDSLYWSGLYSPFAYRYWGLYDPYNYPGSGYVIVEPPGSPSPTPSGEGRVVDGRGYTRVTTRAPEPARINAGDAGNGTMSSSGGSSNGGSNSGSSGVSTGGYSSGGAGDTGRTAMPRPPGGGI